MSAGSPLERSPALWNRSRLELESDECLAQILDRGTIEDWREVYRLAAAADADATRLRSRILRLAAVVPLGFPHLWIAAMRSLGETVEPYPADVGRDGADPFPPR